MELKTGGTHTLLVTPFAHDGELDLRSLCSLIDFTLDNGAVGVVALGTTGEFFTLTPRERVSVMKQVTAHVRTRTTVTVGVGADGTASAIELAEAAEAAGADCVMVLPPFYFDLSPAAQVVHFTAVAKAVGIPVMLYDGSGGIPVSVEVIAAVAAAAANVRYAKLALPDPARVAAVVRQVPGIIPFAGDDTTLVAALRNGAAGSAIATGNIQTKAVAGVHGAFAIGDVEGATRLFATELAPSIMATSTPKNEFVARFKEVLSAKQVIGTAAVRPPLRSVEPGDREELLCVMRTIGVL